MAGITYDGKVHMDIVEKVQDSRRNRLWCNFPSVHGKTIPLGRIIGSPSDIRVHANEKNSTPRGVTTYYPLYI